MAAPKTTRTATAHTVPKPAFRRSATYLPKQAKKKDGSTDKRRKDVEPRTAHVLKESTIEAKIVEYLKSLKHCVQFKHGQNGWHDRIVCYRGLFIGLEVKPNDPSKVRTIRQTQRHEQVTLAGGYSYVVRSVDDVKAIIKQTDQLIKLWQEDRT